VKTTGNSIEAADAAKLVRRAHEHEVIHEDWGTLSWAASKAIGNAEGLTVGRVTIKAGKTNPRHRHRRAEEVLYLLEGEIEHSVGEKSVIMSAGDVITIPPGVFHNARCIGTEDAEMIVVYSEGSRGFEPEQSTRR
jgi:quercetin dioxygenase-like cupin family protein